MSFGIKTLKAKSASTLAPNHSYFKVILMGEELATILTLFSLKEKYTPQEMKLILSRPLSRKDIIHRYEKGLSFIRSENEMKEILREFPELKAYSRDFPAQFYKDGKWHEFNGRAKPMELKPLEDYFQNNGYQISVASLFSDTDWEQFDDIIQKYADIKFLQSIKKAQPQDLAEPHHWELAFNDLSTIHCFDLYTSVHPKQLLKLSQQGQFLPEGISHYLSSVEGKTLVMMNGAIKNPVVQPGTYFIPQSMTHEWGHFILEQKDFDPSTGEWPLSLILIWQGEEFSAEEVAQKIRHAKKVLERIFPELEQQFSHEQIYVTENFLLEDKTSQTVDFDDLSHHHFIYQGAAGFGPRATKFVARELLSAKYLL